MGRIPVFRPGAIVLMAGLWLFPPIGAAIAREQQAALTPPNKFDGVYSVDVVTKKGSCDRYRWTVSVANGHVSSPFAGSDLLDVAGRIGPGGAVLLTFRGQDEIAHAEGRMRGTFGTGKWSSPTLSCSGIWRAERQR